MAEYSPPKSCHFCGKPLEGEKYVWVCRSCGAAWCNEHKKTHFKWNRLVGLDKERCPKCQTILKDNYDLIAEFHTQPEEPVEMKLVSESATTGSAGQAVTEAEARDTLAQGENTATVSEAAPRSIVGPVLMLLFFGALTIYGVIGLFVLASEGLYWILLSLGCIVFGGRVSYHAIGGITGYLKEKRHTEGSSSAD